MHDSSVKHNNNACAQIRPCSLSLISDGKMNRSPLNQTDLPPTSIHTRSSTGAALTLCGTETPGIFTEL